MLNLQVKDAGPVVPYAYGMETMGDRIRFLREAKGLTQTQLGELCGVSKSAVSQWEDGSTTDIKIKPFLALCDALGTSPQYLAFGRAAGTDRPSPPASPVDTGATGRFRRLRAKQP